jgi:hypothetical protein
VSESASMSDDEDSLTGEKPSQPNVREANEPIGISALGVQPPLGD